LLNNNKGIMEKKKYIIPVTEAVRMKNEHLMLTASPGVGGDYDPNEEIGAKENNMFDEETANEWSKHSVWED